ncbi:MAG: flagellar biosynthesis protein FlhF [Gammaproteobacteria bacterium]|nr:flagellar biosynthesis protein FlhF [Gammaproteobacteria bacterium]
MKITRFVGKDMREALNLVSQELGADAVILSSKRVEQGVEVVAATDYDAQLVSAKAAYADVVSPATPRAVKPEPARPSPAPEPVRQSMAAAPVRSAAAMDTPRQAAAAPAMQAVAAPDQAAATRAQEQAINAMREEMRLLRGLVEEQLAGLAWNDARRRHPHKAMLLERFAKLGLAHGIANGLVDSLEFSENLESSWQSALSKLAESIVVTEDDILEQGGVVALVGTTGVGKTTTIAKLAARFALAHGAENVALISTDCYRIAAHEQLRTFAQILGCSVKLVDKAEGLQRAIEQFADKRLVLIDTAGTGQRDQQLGERLGLLAAQGQRVRNYLVLSCTAHKAMLEESLRAFGNLPLAGCILSKLDEAACLGDALSALILSGLPVAYVADGQRVPEDLRVARSVNLVNQAIALNKLGAETPDPWVMARYARRGLTV